MQKKLAVLLTLILMFSVLGGCRNSEETNGGDVTVTDNESVAESIEESDDGGIFDSIAQKESGTLSDYLATEKTICYVVDEMDKAETPDDIYFFQNGKLTILPGSALGLTMGDLSKMTDAEIWTAYETARENYKAEYIAEKEEALQRRIEEVAGNFQYEIEDYQERIRLLEEAKGQTYNLEEMEDGEEFVYTIMEFLYQCMKDGDYELAYTEEELVHYLDSGDGIRTFPEEMLSSAIGCYQSWIEELQASQDTSGFSYKGPFFDMPFTFVVITDASGNYVQEERLIYPTREDSVEGKAPDKLYESLKFPVVEGADRQIYDTTYHCLGVGSESVFCTRASISLDTVDSKNVLIDPPEEEINELFKEEVTARYQ